MPAERAKTTWSELCGNRKRRATEPKAAGSSPAVRTSFSPVCRPFQAMRPPVLTVPTKPEDFFHPDPASVGAGSSSPKNHQIPVKTRVR
jgi:hypothetical protein